MPCVISTCINSTWSMTIDAYDYRCDVSPSTWSCVIGCHCVSKHMVLCHWMPLCLQAHGHVLLDATVSPSTWSCAIRCHCVSKHMVMSSDTTVSPNAGSCHRMPLCLQTHGHVSLDATVSPNTWTHVPLDVIVIRKHMVMCHWITLSLNAWSCHWMSLRLQNTFAIACYCVSKHMVVCHWMSLCLQTHGHLSLCPNTCQYVSKYMVMSVDVIVSPNI